MKKLASLVALAAVMLVGCSSPGYAKHEQLDDALPPLGKLPELAQYVTAEPTPTPSEAPPPAIVSTPPAVVTVTATPTPAAPVTVIQQVPPPAPAPQPEIQIDLPDDLRRLF